MWMLCPRYNECLYAPASLTLPLLYSTSSSSLLPLSLSLVGRLMQWLIVWEVPLSSLAGLEALVRGHIRSFLWGPLCLASHGETQRGGQRYTSYWRNTSMKVKDCLQEAGMGHFAAHYVIMTDPFVCHNETTNTISSAMFLILQLALVNNPDRR